MSEMQALYGVPIQKAIASGDLEKMRELAKQAEDHLTEYGNVSAALEALKVELHRAEEGGAS